MTDWRQRGACVHVDPEAFFPIGGDGADARDAYAAVRRICNGCPVQAECLNAAMREEGGSASGIRFGMRGGLTGYERWLLYRQQAGLTDGRTANRQSSRDRRAADAQAAHLAAQLEAAS